MDVFVVLLEESGQVGFGAVALGMVHALEHAGLRQADHLVLPDETESLEDLSLGHVDLDNEEEVPESEGHVHTSL